MQHERRTMLRLALRLREMLLAELPQPEFSRARQVWADLQRLELRLRAAHSRGDWNLVEELLAAITRNGDLLRLRVQDEINVCRVPQRERQVATARELLHDLQALETEFPGLEIDLRRREVAVTTEEITLEDVPLGRFRIVLHCDRAPLAYSVEALDPNPAAASDSTTHPHVQSESLCEGEGRRPIHAALTQGRLFDFFVLVRQILETYNSGSAYVELSNWHGHLCADCGYSMSSHDSQECTRCGSDVCDECYRECDACHEVMCSECSRSCQCCDDVLCPACRAACDRCQQTVCPACRGTGICQQCRTDEEESLDEQGSETVVAEADAAVQSVCVGEASLPA